MRYPLLVFTALALCYVLMFAVSSYALTFHEIENDGTGRRVLLIRDCGTLASDQRDSEGELTCAPHGQSFRVATGRYKDKAGRIWGPYEGDAARLNSLLSNPRRYDEVWLLSGGGHASAGVDVGWALRDHGMVVRVPNAPRLRRAALTPSGPPQCVSSCTVAFMGGVFRYVDDGATYEMHSSSRVLSGIGDDYQARAASGEFGLLANDVLAAQQGIIGSILRHFQNTLLLPRGIKLPRPEADITLGVWMQRRRANTAYTNSDQEQDQTRFRFEGDAALQDIIMRLERQATTVALDELVQMTDKLGSRSKEALRLVQLMYAVSIKDSFVLSQETMLNLGIVTEDLTIR